MIPFYQRKFTADIRRVSFEGATGSEPDLIVLVSGDAIFGLRGQAAMRAFTTFSSSISDDPPRWNVSQVSALLLMHPAARLQFERAAREFAQWRAVPEAERSPAPAWWWQPAFEVMPPLWCHRLELPLSSTYAAGAAVLMSTLVDQTSLPWPEEFPRKIERAEKLEGS